MKLPRAGLWLNASKPESVLETMILSRASQSCVEIELYAREPSSVGKAGQVERLG